MHSDTSFNEDEYKIDLSVMIERDGIDDDHFMDDNAMLDIEDKHAAFPVDNNNNYSSPVKKRKAQTHQGPISSGSTCLGSIPSLSPATNELFQVTQKKFSLKPTLPQINDLFTGKRLKNDKIDRMVYEMGLELSDDFELDDQMRTRFYKGRFKGNVDNNDELDKRMNSYLEDDKDKENQMSPLKAKNPTPIKKSNRMLFKTPRRTQIPILKPLSNLTNFDANAEVSVKRDSPKRVCIPKHRILAASKSSLKNEPHLIYVVESSTGSINDATKFGTELNASNCEDFPLPEDINEVVQIPTNEDLNSNNQRMAIIKVLRAQKTENGTAKNGFYSSKEWERYNVGSPDDSGVEVVSQNIRRVRFAEQLEW